MAELRRRADESNLQFFHAEWNYDAAEVPTPVNQFLFQQGLPIGDQGVIAEAIIIFGHANPPVVLPGVDGVPRVVGLENNDLPVTVVSRITMSIPTLVDLHKKLGEFIQTQTAVPAP
jgi:hypothetical protein